MASSSMIKLSYQKLHKLPTTSDDHEPSTLTKRSSSSSSRRRRSNWLRLDNGVGRRRRWHRPRVTVAGLRRLIRRKAMAVRSAVAKVARRLKEGRPYAAELFAGNYMFMQVGPSPTATTTTTTAAMATAMMMGFSQKQFSTSHHAQQQHRGSFPQHYSARFSY
ncbi:uncharacterized protein LOC109724275 [Ananas comosus]|uniref:Uncharacterized protein LOC109724275 n=1 Tax=Ananas comosus TaxID=4615 RepID=A0A6P5GRT4_ANACO|nr:uncharacterized protein LOC109724275 [Ananas comosus]